MGFEPGGRRIVDETTELRMRLPLPTNYCYLNCFAFKNLFFVISSRIGFFIRNHLHLTNDHLWHYKLDPATAANSFNVRAY